MNVFGSNTFGQHTWCSNVFTGCLAVSPSTQARSTGRSGYRRAKPKNRAVVLSIREVRFDTKTFARIDVRKHQTVILKLQKSEIGVKISGRISSADRSIASNVGLQKSAGCCLSVQKRDVALQLALGLEDIPDLK